MPVHVVGIGGVSNGGKTTLAKETASFLTSKGINVHVFNQDDYYKDEKELEYDEKNDFYLWDVTEAFNMNALLQDLKSKIKYENARNEECVIIVEGILIFNHKKLNELFTKRFFITLTKNEASRRRQTRIYDPPDNENIFPNHVWPKYLNHFEDLRRNKIDMKIVDGEWTTSHSSGLITQYLSNLIVHTDLHPN